MFNLENYETVKQRKQRFYKDNLDGRIIVELLNQDSINEYALFKCNIYKTKEDYINKCPVSTGYAHELRITEKSISRKGEEYEPVNYSSWVENCEESAIGRALDNAGYNNGYCSLEEIEKVKKYNENEIKKDKPSQTTPTGKNKGTQSIALSMIKKIKDKKMLDDFYKTRDRYSWTENEILQQDKEIENIKL